WTGRDTSRDEFLITAYDDGSATIAYRNLASRTWGPPRDLEQGKFSRQCIGCGEQITGMAVYVFETYPRSGPNDTGMHRTDDLMCIRCGGNGGNVVPARDSDG